LSYIHISHFLVTLSDMILNALTTIKRNMVCIAIIRRGSTSQGRALRRQRRPAKTRSRRFGAGEARAGQIHGGPGAHRYHEGEYKFRKAYWTNYPRMLNREAEEKLYCVDL